MNPQGGECQEVAFSIVIDGPYPAKSTQNVHSIHLPLLFQKIALGHCSGVLTARAVLLG